MQAFIADYISIGSVDFSDELYSKIFFSGCDFKCPYCNTPEMVEAKLEHQVDLREIKKELESDRILITGGEPCFQKAALVEILKWAKESGKKTAIDTNGSKPEVIELLLRDGLVNTIIMDLKAPFENFEKITKSQTFFKPESEIIGEIKQTLGILKAYDEKIDIIFRTTIVPGLLFRKEDLKKIANQIEGINCSWELKPFRSGIILDKRMKDINSPTEQFMQNIKEYLIKETSIIIR